MKFNLSVECDCGSKTDLSLKRTIIEFEGKVYDDYTSLGATFKDDKSFSSNQSFEDVTYIKCLKCNKEHELHI